MKQFNTQRNIGKAKYVINYHGGVKTHSVGSAFFSIKIFKSKKASNAGQKDLLSSK